MSAAAAAADGTSRPAAEADADPLVDFLDYLSRHGYPVGQVELLRANELLLAVLTQDRLPATMPERLALLQPLVCRTAEQQRQFPLLLARWSPPVDGGRRRNPRGRAAAGGADTDRLPRWPTLLRWVVAGLLALLLVGLAALAWQTCEATGLCRAADTTGAGAEAPTPRPTDRAASPAAPTPPADDAALPVNPAEPPGHLPIADPATRPGSAASAWVLPLIGGLSMATLTAMVALLLLRRLALQPLRTDARLEQRTLFAPRVGLLRKVPPLLRRVSRELRRPRRTDRLELDLGRTIAATVAGGGAFAARWRARSGTPEYLVLIDQRGPHDQLARAAADIVAALDRQGVALQAWRFNGDPSICTPLRLDAVGAGGRPAGSARRRVRLTELAARAAGQRLLVFADAADWVDPLSGALRDGLDALTGFGACMLFTPMPAPGWGAAERALDRHGVLVLPLQLQGLSSGADWLSSQRALLTLEADWPATYPPRLLQHALLWLARADAPPPDELAGLLFQLQLYLGPRRFQWLCGCAAFPVPSWPVTLALAPLFLAPGDDVVTGAVALASLPWLREGAWPLWLREALQQRLAPSEADAVARELRRRLDAASLGRPTETADALAEVALAPGLQSRLRHAAAQAWRRFATDAWVGRSAGRLRRDVLFLGFVQRGVAQRLMQRVPERLRRQVFREGVPLLGLRPWLPALALLLSVGGIALQLPPGREGLQAFLDGAAGVPGLPEVASYMVPGVPASALTFSPDGSRLAVGFVDGSVVLLRRDGQVDSVLQQPEQPGPVNGLQFSRNGRVLLIMYRESATTLRYQVLSRQGDRPFNASLPAGSLLALSGDGGTLAVAEAGKPILLLPLDARRWSPVNMPSMSGAAPLIPAAGARSFLVGQPYGRVALLDGGTAQTSRSIDVGIGGTGPMSDVTALALGSASGHVAIANGKQVSWQPLGGGEPDVVFNDLAAPAVHLAASPDGRAILATLADGSVRLLPLAGRTGAGWSTQAGTLRAEFSADGSQVVGFGRDAVLLWPAAGGEPLGRIPMAPRVAAANGMAQQPAGALSPNGRQLAVVGSDGQVRLLGERLPAVEQSPWRLPVGGTGTEGAASTAASAAGPYASGSATLGNSPAAPGSGAAANPAASARGLTVPDVVGLSWQAALEALRRARIEDGVRTDQEAVDFCPGLVLAQRPAASAPVTAKQAVQLTEASNSTEFFPLTCRGDVLERRRGAGALSGFEQIEFTMRQAGDAPASGGLEPGQCTWDDRGFRPGEPLRVRVDVTPRQVAALLPALASRDRYLRLRAVNRGEWLRAGCLLSADAKAPGPARAPSGTTGAAASATAASMAWVDLADAFFDSRSGDVRYGARQLQQQLAASSTEPSGDASLLALGLAIVKTEAGDFQPRTERASAANTSRGGQPFDLYDADGRFGKGLGNTEAGDGARYRGRGLLMIVGRANYARYGRLANVGDLLVREPEQAASQDIAMRVLVGALLDISPRLKRPIDAAGVRTAQRLFNGSTAADRLIRNFEAAKPLAAALAQAAGQPPVAEIPKADATKK